MPEVYHLELDKERVAEQEKAKKKAYALAAIENLGNAYEFKSYAADGETQIGEGVVVATGNIVNEKQELLLLKNTPDIAEFAPGTKLYSPADTPTDGTLFPVYNAAGEDTGMKLSITKVRAVGIVEVMNMLMTWCENSFEPKAS